MNGTHRLKVIHPCAKYGKTNVKPRNSYGPDTTCTDRQTDRQTGRQTDEQTVIPLYPLNFANGGYNY